MDDWQVTRQNVSDVKKEGWREKEEGERVSELLMSISQVSEGFQ
jgi:hypothetical protein